MSARSDKERRQQKKKHDEKRRRAALQAELARQTKSPAPNLSPRPAAPLPPPPAKPARERTAIDDWWDEYEAADGAGQLRMLREKLETVQLADEWYQDVFDEAITSLENRLSEAEYIAFLEELRTKRPDVFADGAEWHTWSMAFCCVAEERWEALDRAIFEFAGAMTEISEPYFSMTSLIRLAGRAEPAQRLIEAAMSPEISGELTSWTLSELIGWALFAPYQACVQAGVTDEAVDELFRYAVRIGCRDTDKDRQRHREFALHLAGKADRWTRDDLLKEDNRAGRRVLLLAADYMRWLCASRGFEPVVADELRRILVYTIDDMKRRPAALLRGLRREDLEPVLARKLGVFSLDRAHAVAGIVAMRHFYDFLAESELADRQKRESAHTVCDAMWKDLQRALKDDWRHYRFLGRYMPQAAQ